MIEISTQTKAIDIDPYYVDLITKIFGSEIFISKTVNELISGYHDPLMSIAKTILPNLIRDDKFSLNNGVSCLI